MVFKSFKNTLLVNKLDHGKDNNFSSWKKMQTEVPLINNELEKKYYKYEQNFEF